MGALLWLKGAWKAITSPLGLTILLAIGLALAGWRIHATIYAAGAESRQAEVDAAEAKFTDAVKAAKAAREESERKAREVEERQRAALALIAEGYEREKRNGQAANERLVAELRSNAVRLRAEWRGCEADSAFGLSDAATGAARPAGTAELRERGAVDLVSLARDCDSRIRALQEIIRGR